MAEYTITDNFSGGNITVEKISCDKVFVKIDNRDSKPWCHWAFKVIGAQGKTIKFEFGKDAVGYFGAAVSYDLINWHWSNADSFRSEAEERYSFVYTFSENESEVYFSHNMLYIPEAFDSIDFMEKSVLCTDSDNSLVPLATMGEGKNIILLTARHHACEAPANYVLEGVLRELYNNLPQNYKVIAVPFVDMAGVVAGDQGKDRLPHDHNRDYINDSIYPTVKAMKKLLQSENIKYVFDFHSPCHLGGGNDSMSLVNAYECLRPQMEFLSMLFARELNEDCFTFYPHRITWRDKPLEGTFSAYCGAQENIRFVATMETPYFGEKNNIMTQSGYIATGRAFGRAIKKFIDRN